MESKATKFSIRGLVGDSTDFLEFLADHFNGTLGHILIKASPLLAPLPSAIAIYAALSIKFHWFPALVTTLVVEGLGFAAVDARNKIEEHNRSGGKLDSQKAQTAVTMYFVVTLLTILGFETIPAWGKLWNGVEGYTFVDALGHTAPIVFPFFSNVGASIYSLMDVLNAVDKRQSEKENDHVGALRSQLASAEQSLSEQKASFDNILVERDIEQQRALVQAVELERQKVSSEYEVTLVELRTELRMMREQNARSMRSENRVSNTKKRTSNGQSSQFDRRVRVLDLWKHHGQLSLGEAEGIIGASKSTISGDLKWLEDKEVIHRTIDPDSGKTVVHVNGNEPAFRAGELN